MSNDLISREALKTAIEEVQDNYDGYEPNDLGKFMNKVDDLIDSAPTVEARPQGEWTAKEETPASVSYYCSVCKAEGIPITPFCPWCGASMKGGAE